MNRRQLFAGIAALAIAPAAKAAHEAQGTIVGMDLAAGADETGVTVIQWTGQHWKYVSGPHVVGRVTEESLPTVFGGGRVTARLYGGGMGGGKTESVRRRLSDAVRLAG